MLICWKDGNGPVNKLFCCCGPAVDLNSRSTSCRRTNVMTRVPFSSNELEVVSTSAWIFLGLGFRFNLLGLKEMKSYFLTPLLDFA